MSKKYYLKYKDNTIGYFIEDKDVIRYEPIKDEADKLPIVLGYPFGLFVTKTDVKPWVPNKNKVTTSEGIMNWLSERTFSKERPDSKYLLETLGLSQYHPWEIVKKTKGVTHHDNYWITDNLSEKYIKHRESHIIQILFMRKTHIIYLMVRALQDNMEYLQSASAFHELSDLKLNKGKYINNHSPENYETYFYASLIMTAYTFIENELREYCFYLGEQLGLPIAEKNAKETHLDYVKRYLHNHLSIEIDTHYWYELDCLRIIRNHLAHKGPLDSERLFQIKRIQQYLIIHELSIGENNNSFFNIHKDYCAYAIRFISEFFNQLHYSLSATKGNVKATNDWKLNNTI